MNHSAKLISIVFLTMFVTTAGLRGGEIYDDATAGDLNNVRVLIEADSTFLKSKDNDGDTPFITAFKILQVAATNILMDKGTNVNARGMGEGIPLLWTKMEKDESFVCETPGHTHDVYWVSTASIPALHSSRETSTFRTTKPDDIRTDTNATYMRKPAEKTSVESVSMGSTIRVEQGVLSGAPGSDPSVMVFKGVPFAAPPVGELRWRAPRAPAAWEGIRKADEFSPNCMQMMREGLGPWTAEYQPHGAVSEDCLYLNIWTAAKSLQEKRPVVVYFHGGAFTDGSGNVPVYNGENLAKKGLVVVTVNYRLGVLGFFAHPDLTKESDHKSSGNYGLLDQVAALEWIKKNIAAFGGDPSLITIMGQSAGAMSVHCLTASPLAKGLFVRAIAQSGSNAFSGPDRSLASAEKTGVKFAEAKGTNSSLAALRAMPVAELIAPVKGDFRFFPIVDGWFLPKSIDEIFAAGEQNDVATLTGWVADEGIFSDDYGKASAEEFHNRVKQQAGSYTDEILNLYPALTETEAIESQKAYARDISMVSMYLWAVKHGTTGKTKVYTYLFTHPQPGATKDRYMTFHSSELPYVFDNLNQSNRPWTAKDSIIAEAISSYWTNFIATGDPNGEGLPKWPTFKQLPAETMELGDRMGLRPIVSREKFRKLLQVVAN